MRYQAKLVADSIGPARIRLTTMEVTYPLMVHAEHLRHRSFSFSVASNRAIPTRKILEQVIKSPVVPVWFGKNQPGMSAREELDGWRFWMAHKLWLAARWPAVVFVWLLLKVGLHKQVANRVLSPWQWVTMLATGTDWDNFFALRCHPDAQPEIRTIAEMMRDLMVNAAPTEIGEGGWHLPLVGSGELVRTYEEHEDDDDAERELCMVSAARCARVTLLNHGKAYTAAEEIVKAEALMRSGHFSPFEHQAQALPDDRRVANLRGWMSFRATIPDEANFGKVRDEQV